MREILAHLQRPSHYTGAEIGCVRKDPEKVSLHIGLAFPDTYEVGMSYLGQKILYAIVNENPSWWAERVMAPEVEAAQTIRNHACLLSTLESDTPLDRLHALCFSITHELCYADVLQMLDLGGIPLRQKERDQDLRKCPVVIAGGGAMMGAEPLSPFLDLVALGDGEELLPEILELLEQARAEGWPRDEFLVRAAEIPGIYVPSLFEPDESGRLVGKIPGYVPRRRIVTDLNTAPCPVKQVVPVGAIQNRLSLEIARGCTRGCRFCHAGMIYRPVRERDPDVVAEVLEECLQHTGFDEVSFLSLSAGDCTALKTIHKQAFERCRQEQIALGLPSLRVGSVDDEIMASQAALRRVGCTLAPEAGSQRLRDVINKGVTEEGLLLHLRKLLEHGWRQVKLYFMIGLPTETDADLEAIVELCRKARDAGGPGAPKLQITAAISPFVPKPFTPFQWECQPDLSELKRRINLLSTSFRKCRGIKMKWHAPEMSHLEGILSRGGRELADVVEKAWRKGAIFCSWTEKFTLQPWLEAMEECGLDPRKYIGAREEGAGLPWEHLEVGISRDFLLRERKKALQGQTTRDCRYGECSLCGSCDTKHRESALARRGLASHKLVFSRRDQEEHQPRHDEQGRLVLKEYENTRPNLPPQLVHKAVQLRIWHTKERESAWLGHLELQATILKALRRAGVPVTFSQGFHPLPLISFGRALPVGAESKVEWFGLHLNQFMKGISVIEKLQPFLPSGLTLLQCEIADIKKEGNAISEKFAIEPGDEHLLAAADAFGAFFEKESCLITRESKKGLRTVDARPLVLNWKISAGDSSRIIFTADWSGSYLSPLLLAQTIFPALNEVPFRLVKIGQTFASGREYDSGTFGENIKLARQRPGGFNGINHAI